MGVLAKNNSAVLSFGELLLRICPDAEGEWLNENKLPFYVGGAELNVATALALWDVPSRYFTALPDNDITQQILNSLSSKRIDTSKIYLGGYRMGLYFLTQRKDLKHDALVYDRANSSFSALKPGVIDWDNVLEDVSWFHFSAICPAISQNVANVCLEGVKAASKKGITVSVDLNYRSKLWQYGVPPASAMPQLMPYCDLVMGNIWAAETMLGIPVQPDIHQSGSKKTYLDAAFKTSLEVTKQYPKCKAVANTFRFDADGTINYYTTIYDNKDLIISAEYDSADIIDKVGSGDCFMAGLIYGFYNQYEIRETLEFATAAAFDKLFIKSDATNRTVDEIKKVIKHD